MTVRAGSELVIWQGTPRGFFPQGEHAFPARRDILRALLVAVEADLNETHLVGLAEREADEPRPLALTHLRAFFQAHDATLAATLARPAVRDRSRALGASRIARLRELDAPPLFLAHETEALARIDDEPWAPRVDPFAGVADVLGAASMLDVAGRRKRRTPLTVSIDIADVVLVALHCAIAPEAESIAEDWLDQLVWTPFVREAEETAIPPQTIRVRPAIYAAGASVLAFSVADALPDGKLAPGGALVRVRPPDEDDG